MVDPRAYSEEKLVPPDPLPVVSRRALKRVKEPFPVPEHCPYCGPDQPVVIAHHAEIYGGREYGDWPYMYFCRECGARIGIHPATDIPLGTMADAELRRARVDNKKRFHAVKDRYGMSRSEAYEWLAQELGIDPAECHWGWFSVDQCQQAGRICENELTNEAKHG